MTVAACYARQSKTDAEELATGVSLSSETQIAKAEQFAGVHEWRFDGDLSRACVDLDTTGGANAKHRKSGTPSWQRRPGLMRLYEAAKAGKLQHLICYKLDRLGRDAAELHQIRDAFHDADCVIHIVSEGIRSDTPGGELVFGVLASVAQMERRQISDRLRDVSLQRARRGLHHSREPGWITIVPGTTPADGPAHYAIDPVPAANILLVVEMRLSGKSYAEITRTLNAEGRLTSKGTTWTRGAVQDVLDINSRLRYRGCAVYGRDRLTADPLRVISPGVFPQLLDPATSDALDAVQDALVARSTSAAYLSAARRSGQKIVYRKTQYMLAGMIECAVCGSPLISHGTTKAVEGGARETVRDYYCRGAANSDLLHPGRALRDRVNGMHVAAGRIEPAVIHGLAAIQRILQAAQPVSKPRPPRPARKVAQATTRTVREITEAIDRLYALGDAGRIEQRDYDRRYAALVKERQELEAQQEEAFRAVQQEQAALRLSSGPPVDEWSLTEIRVTLGQLTDKLLYPVFVEGITIPRIRPKTIEPRLEHVQIVLKSPLPDGTTSVLSGLYRTGYQGARHVITQVD